MNSWFITKLFQNLECAEKSECYRRCTMWKLTRRFFRLTYMDADFYTIMNEVCCYMEGESLGGWIKRCSFTHQEEFMDLCVLHYVHTWSRGLKLDQGSIPAQVLARYEELLKALPNLLDVHILNVVSRELEESKELSPFVHQQLTHAFCIFLKPLYRFKLLHLLSLEKDQRRRVVLIKYGCKKKQIVNYFGTPNYFRKPVKGPFRVEVPRTSKLLRLYGTQPNPEYFYCECRGNGDMCGHVLTHDYSFRHKF